MGAGITSGGCCNCGPTSVSMEVILGALCPLTVFAGLVVTVSGPGGYSQTQTTNGSGVAFFTGVFYGSTYTIGYTTPVSMTAPFAYQTPRWTQLPLTFTPEPGAVTYTGGWVVSDGYLCSCSCLYPISNRLVLSNIATYVGTFPTGHYTFSSATLIPGWNTDTDTSSPTPPCDVYSFDGGATGISYGVFYDASSGPVLITADNSTFLVFPTSGSVVQCDPFSWTFPQSGTGDSVITEGTPVP